MIHSPCKWDLQGPDLGPEPWSDFSVMMWGMKLNVQRAYWFGTKMPLRKNLFILLLNGKEEPQEGEKAHCTWLANSLLASCRGSIDIDNLSTISGLLWHLILKNNEIQVHLVIVPICPSESHGGNKPRRRVEYRPAVMSKDETPCT